MKRWNGLSNILEALGQSFTNI